jgi:hypothetical protein
VIPGSASSRYNVYPREVEEVLYTHPAVAEAAVVGRPDDRLGEELLAHVALKPGETVKPEEPAGSSGPGGSGANCHISPRSGGRRVSPWGEAIDHEVDLPTSQDVPIAGARQWSGQQ